MFVKVPRGDVRGRRCKRTSNQLRDRITAVEQVLWAAAVVGDRHMAGVDPELTIERREDVLIVDRPILGDFAEAVGGSDHLTGRQTTAGEQTAGGLGPVIAAGVPIDPRCPPELTPSHDADVIRQPPPVQVADQRRIATIGDTAVATIGDTAGTPSRAVSSAFAPYGRMRTCSSGAPAWLRRGYRDGSH